MKGWDFRRIRLGDKAGKTEQQGKHSGPGAGADNNDTRIWVRKSCQEQVLSFDPRGQAFEGGTLSISQTEKLRLNNLTRVTYVFKWRQDREAKF